MSAVESTAPLLLQEQFQKIQECAGNNVCQVDFAHIDRSSITEEEVGALTRLFEQHNANRDDAGIIGFMPYMNFGIDSSGIARGFCCVFKSNARVHRSPFQYKWFGTRVLFAINEKNKGGVVRLTPNYFETAEMRAQLLGCIAEQVPEGARGYDATIITKNGRYDDGDRVPVMGFGDSRVGIVSYIPAHDTTKRHFFICIDVNQPALSTQVNTLIDMACEQNLTMKEMMTSTELTVDGVSAATVFGHGEEIALRAAHAIGKQVCDTMNLSFAKCNPDLMGLNVSVASAQIPVAAAVTVYNRLYMQKGKSGVDKDERIAYYSDAVNTRAHGTTLFPRLAINGYTAVCGLARKKTNATIFDTLPWSSVATYNGLPADTGRVYALDQLDPKLFHLENMPAEVKECVSYTFVFEQEEEEEEEDQRESSMNHMFCQRVYTGADSDESLARMNAKIKRAFKACKIDGSNESLYGIPLNPVQMKVGRTHAYDLRLAPGDTMVPSV